MNFRKYQHVEKLGRPEVEGILDGTVYVYPKLDGANASAWRKDDGTIGVGSRNQDLSQMKGEQVTRDLGGLPAYVKGDDRFRKFFAEHPQARLYGEWLVPHTLRTYRVDAWCKLYVFDVYDGDRLLPWPEAAELLDQYDIEYIPPLAIIDRPSMEQLERLLDSNTYLIKDGCGAGEGIVLKNYDFINTYGRTTWAKIVRNEFKEKNAKEFGVKLQPGQARIEDAMADMLDPNMVYKVVANLGGKVALAKPEVRHTAIPRLLNTVWYDYIKEDLWDAIKKHKNPIVNFKTLHKAILFRTKQLLPEVF